MNAVPVGSGMGKSASHIMCLGGGLTVNTISELVWSAGMRILNVRIEADTYQFHAEVHHHVRLLDMHQFEAC